MLYYCRAAILPTLRGIYGQTYKSQVTNPRNETDKSLLRKRKMGNNAPLKPPEYKRNELGQFDRPGKTLSKTAKPNKKTENNLQGRPGPGRPPGSQNKITVALKEAILAAGEAAGGAEGLTGYLTRLAVENSSAYAGLLAKILPSTLAADANSDGGNVEIRFVRQIVYPGGRIESDDTPKQLPPPASHTLPMSGDHDLDSAKNKDLDD